MTKIIFIDTETTGLPNKRNVPAIEENNNWPDLVSISWMIFENGSFIKQETHIIKPEGFIIPKESIAIHNITTEQAKKEGVPLRDVLRLFKNDLKEYDNIIAHNMEFDKNVIFHAYKWRLQEEPTFWNETKEICTMLKAKNEMKLLTIYPRKGDMYKNPSLYALYNDTFKETLSASEGGAHTAEGDVNILQKVWWKRWV